MTAAPPRLDPRRTLPISGLVICKDEEDHIAACLQSLAACRELIVVDSGSTDRTVPIVEALARDGLPIVLVHQAWLGYAGQKQVALQHATQPWCLSLDADERLDAVLRDSLPGLIAAPDAVAGWRLRRLTANLGEGPLPRGVYAKPVLRLVRRAGARFDERALVHEGLIVDGRTPKAAAGVIVHERELPLASLIGKQLDYARLKATERRRRGRKPSLLRLVGNPPVAFLRLFLLHRWFLCGRRGFTLAVTGAIYAFAAEALQFEQSEKERSGV